METFIRTRRIILTLVFLLGLISPASPATQNAQARLLAECRADPLVVLSDGTILDISADVGAFLWEVEEVHYVLHIPAGLEVVVALSTPNWPTTIEKFTVHADNPADTFTSTTTVITRRGNTPVTANFLVNTTYRTLGGVSGEGLTIEIRK